MVVPRATQLSIFPGSVNKDQFRLGRQRQVWFIPFVYKCEVVPERGTISSVIYLHLPVYLATPISGCLDSQAGKVGKWLYLACAMKCDMAV